ncbi:MAG: hypothetical protein ACPGSD_01415 [Flavobacteriales bacterium]
MKKTVFLFFLSFIGLNFAQAQKIGIYYGSNTNFISNDIDIVFNEVSPTSGLPVEKDRKYKSDWGREYGLTYRTDVSHAFSLEYNLGYQKLVTVLQETITEGSERKTNSYDFDQSYIILRPTLHFWLNDNWSFTGNATLRMGLGGNFHQYTAPVGGEKGVFTAGENNVFDENHLDMGIGINYEMDMGLGLYLNYQKPLLNFNSSPVDDYRPLSTVAFGISFRIDKEKLEKFGK